MDKELQELGRRLFDKRRHDGTACALVHGQPGGGKSHLARQYVHKNRKKFNGGVFWIVSHSRDERYQAFEAIFQKAVARETTDANPKLNQGQHSIVESVKAWFESRQEWLIVFDGVSVETDADLDDLAKFIPDSQNSSLIYVSRQRNLESRQRLLRPHAIRVQTLKPDDARKLLFKELGIRGPSDDELKSGIKLVKQVDCLPLAIIAISHRIADTHEPLIRYSMKSYSANPKLESTYNQILDDLQRLGHMEAWNLMSLLAFFGQDVPVEMLHLGIKALQDVPVKSSEGSGKPDLNVTFSILMRHALLGRNEPDSGTSSSRDSLVEPEPIDMLKIHSVIQSFCRDSLNARGMLPEWLQHATQLLESSYHSADAKIKDKEQQARVSDYRYYLVHCKRLHEHASHYESRRQSLAPVRAVLEPLLETIEESIRSLEPASSQESVVRTYQVSIFDRTTSSSDSVVSVPSAVEARTPSHRPSPLPLAYETLWGTDARKPSLESPASIGSARTPRIVGHSPYQGFYDDFGYESDRETPHHTSHPMGKNVSERTERPQPTQPEQHEEGWQVVPATRRSRKPRAGRDLGSFRPRPATTARAPRAEVNRRSAMGTVARSTERPRESDRSSSPTKAALSKVHSRSPPPSRSLSSNVTSFWQRRPLASGNSSLRTWANVAAGQEHHPRIQPTPPTPVAPIIPNPASTKAAGGQSKPYSSPLASEIHPDGEPRAVNMSNGAHVSMRAGHDSGPPTEPMPSNYPNPEPGPWTDPSQPRYMNNEHLYSAPSVAGSNPSSLPIDDNISISSKRRLPEEFRNDGSPTQYPTSAYPGPPSQPSYPSHYPSYETFYPQSSMPSGYYSQPMSRNQSRQSHMSAAETEPVRYPSPRSFQHNAAYPDQPSSPRDRHPDGRPLHKSPRSDCAFPVSIIRISPQDPSQSLPGVGGWAYSHHDEPRPISRSLSGPGLAIDNASGHGLGIIPFNGRLQFGDHDLISVEEARQRTWEREQSHSRSRERGREQRQNVTYPESPYAHNGPWAAYPEINLIPTQSDAQALRAMTGQYGI